MYDMLCTRPVVGFVVGMVNRSQSYHGKKYLTEVKHIINYLKRTWDYMLDFHFDNFVTIGYTKLNFQLDRNSRKSTS